MKEIKLLPQEPITFTGPNLETLQRVANERIQELRESGKKIAYSTMYAVIITPLVLEISEVETKKVVKPKIKAGTPVVSR